MQIFVINLASAKDRLAYISEQLAGNFIRIVGVNGWDVPPRLAANFERGVALLPGEVGCYASHLVAAEAILERDLKWAVVIEDDVVMVKDFQQIVYAAVAAVEGEWDIISLSGSKQHPHRHLAAVGDRSLVRYLHFPKTTAAYAISRSGCKKLLSTRRRNRPIDVDIRYGWEMDLTGYGVYPPPAQQTGKFPSSIGSKSQRFYWRANVSGYLVGRYRSAKRFGLRNLLRGYARPRP